LNTGLLENLLPGLFIICFETFNIKPKNPLIPRLRYPLRGTMLASPPDGIPHQLA